VISFRKRLSLSGIDRRATPRAFSPREDVMAQFPIGASHAPARDLVVLAGSAGGMDALHVILGALPADFSGAIAVVQHRMASHGGLLGELLRTWTDLEVRDACEGDVLTAGTVFIAPPDLHMSVTAAGTISLMAGGAIHHVLSSADPLFASAAVAYGERLTAVVLTGGDGDGSAGVRSVRLEGGVVIAQHPDTAACPDMPRSAIATGMVDWVLPLHEIADVLVRRTNGSLDSGRERPVGAP
jgi:two-component system, chemotaxis family, protein-glutamate methylesterase/glutaminase